MKSMQGFFVSGEFQNGMVASEAVAIFVKMLDLVLIIIETQIFVFIIDVKKIHLSESFFQICPSFRTNWGRSCPFVTVLKKLRQK